MNSHLLGHCCTCSMTLNIYLFWCWQKATKSCRGRVRNHYIYMYINFFSLPLQRTSACVCHHSPISRVLSTSSHSDSSSDYVYDHLQPYRTLDDDYVRASRDPSVSVKKSSRESLRRFLSANDISYKQVNSECLPHIESPAQDISSLQHQLAFLYAPEIQPDTIV